MPARKLKNKRTKPSARKRREARISKISSDVFKLADRDYNYSERLRAERVDTYWKVKV